MKLIPSLVLALLLAGSSAFGQGNAPGHSNNVLHNNDVLRMHMQGIPPGKIITKIVTSSCNFDIFPPVMRDLKRRGLPDTVLTAMKMVPYGPPATVADEKAEDSPKRAPVQIPAGVVVGLAPANVISSADVKNESPIIFLVTRRVLVNEVLVIERGAVARGRVVKTRRAGSWGRAGTIEFVLKDVIAVDGTRVPIQLSDHVKGSNHSKAVTAAAIITGAIAFPYSPPVALFWALKKGDDAVLDQSTKFIAVVRNEQSVEGLPPEKRKTIYHAVNSLNTAGPANGTGLQPASDSFRPTPIRHK